MLTAEQLAGVTAIFDKYEIPKSIWYPIMLKESSGNPLSTASTSKELSEGLFQINVKAHPQYANVNLYDPLVNAQIAAENFISPAYNYAKSYTSDNYLQALITYSGLKNPNEVKTSYSKSDFISWGGIRPQWTAGVKDAFTKLYDSNIDITSGGTVSTGTITSPGVETYSSNIDLTPTQSIGKFIIIILIICIAVIALFMLFKNSSLAKTASDTVTDAILPKTAGEIIKAGGKK